MERIEVGSSREVEIGPNRGSTKHGAVGGASEEKAIDKRNGSRNASPQNGRAKEVTVVQGVQSEEQEVPQ